MLVPRTPLQAYLLDAAEPEVDAQADRWLAGVLTFSLIGILQVGIG